MAATNAATAAAAAAADTTTFYVYDNPINHSVHADELFAVFGTPTLHRLSILSMEGRNAFTTSDEVIDRAQQLLTDFAKSMPLHNTTYPKKSGVNTGIATDADDDIDYGLLPQAIPALVENKHDDTKKSKDSIDTIWISETETSTTTCEAWDEVETGLGGYATSQMCLAIMMMMY